MKLIENLKTLTSCLEKGKLFNIGDDTFMGVSTLFLVSVDQKGDESWVDLSEYEVSEYLPIQFNEVEKTILSNLNADYKYLTRDDDGRLLAHIYSPKRLDNGTWEVTFSATDLTGYKHLFKCIQPHSEVRYKFREYLK